MMGGLCGPFDAFTCALFFSFFLDDERRSSSLACLDQQHITPDGRRAVCLFACLDRHEWMDGWMGEPCPRNKTTPLPLHLSSALTFLLLFSCLSMTSRIFGQTRGTLKSGRREKQRKTKKKKKKRPAVNGRNCPFGKEVCVGGGGEAETNESFALVAHHRCLCTYIHRYFGTGTYNVYVRMYPKKLADDRRTSQHDSAPRQREGGSVMTDHQITVCVHAAQPTRRSTHGLQVPSTRQETRQDKTWDAEDERSLSAYPFRFRLVRAERSPT
ncbi:hypothetical protein IWX46DRAFT_282322 [Phyllosticta citricarpa]|uniref:Uncharacterized protein n=1 Tax=Phyllosticta citricarpa TaxID=55181 RepID=A0ABR1MLX8_9PEZI